MHICLFEDGAEQLGPLGLTRPVFDLRCGMTTLGQKQLRAFGPAEWGMLVRPALAGLSRTLRHQIAVNDSAWMQGGDLLLVNGRWVPPRGRIKTPTASCLGRTGDGVAFVFLKTMDVPALSFEELPELLEHWQSALEERPAGGRLIAYPWDLVELNAAEIHRDFECIAPLTEVAAPATVTVLGPRAQLWVAPSAKVEPLVVADTTQGPIVIDEDAVIAAFTRLEGPCYVGPGSQVLGAKIRAGTSLGPQCRVGGEIEASILHGYSNKYHDGFLGHSYVGEWVNLGAGTHNSDLRNDYGEVTVTIRGLPTPTGINKVGCFLGDHTKTGLGTLLNTGTNVGAFCNLLPAGRFTPKYVPSFTSWWNGSLTEAFTLEQLLTTAEIAMQRRGVTLTDAHRTLYSRLMEGTAAERRRVLCESEQRLLRRSA